MSRKTKAERRALKNQWQRTLQPPPHDGESESESGGTGRACRDLFSVPEGRICSQCRTRPAVSAFTTDGLMGAIHGAYDYRCNLCILMAQWINIQEQIARLAEVAACIDAEVKASGIVVGASVRFDAERVLDASYSEALGDTLNPEDTGRVGTVKKIAWCVVREEPPRVAVQVYVAFPGSSGWVNAGALTLEPTP